MHQCIKAKNIVVYHNTFKKRNENEMSALVDGLSSAARSAVAPIANLVARIYLGLVFFQSGLSKVEDWQTTMTQFRSEWFVPVLSPSISAWLATGGEIILSLLLIVGFFTRFAASGLFIMVMIIEFIVFNGASADSQYYYWMIILGLLIGYGSDKLSFDAFLSRKKDRRFH